MQIAPLCQHPQHLTSLARAHLQAFGGLLPDWTLDQACAELASHQAPEGLPTTWIALDGARWLGSVSLLAGDDPGRDPYTPWLASLYVRPEARACGTGAALVAHCGQAAQALGISNLYLYCQDQLVGYYTRLGWTVVGRLLLGPLQVVVMAIQPGTFHV